jgi:hypothetical protein
VGEQEAAKLGKMLENKLTRYQSTETPS